MGGKQELPKDLLWFLWFTGDPRIIKDRFPESVYQNRNFG